MASLKDLRRRIRATKSMQQIFKAMEMVAAAKLRRAQQRAQSASPYAAKISAMLANLSGAYNTAILRVAEQRLKAAAPGSIQCVVVGRKGRDYLRRRGYPVLAAHT